MSLIEPTQDGGYQDFSPLVRRFVEAPASTVETVKLHELKMLAVGLPPHWTVVADGVLCAASGRPEWSTCRI